MMVIDPSTGKKAKFGAKKTIIEAYKKNRIEDLSFSLNKELKYRFNKDNILQFY